MRGDSSGSGHKPALSTNALRVRLVFGPRDEVYIEREEILGQGLAMTKCDRSPELS
jgi:hypothetical protein